MTDPSQPTPWHVAARWMIRLSWWRLRNRVAAMSKKKSAKRGPSARKRNASLLLIFVWLYLAFFSGFQCLNFVRNLAIESEERDRQSTECIVVGPAVMRALGEFDEQTPDVTLSESLRRAILTDIGPSGVNDTASTLARVARLSSKYRQHGKGGFCTSMVSREPFSTAHVWYESATHPITTPLTLLLAILLCCVSFASVATAGQDLARPEWMVEWFYTLPVSARDLFLARILETALVNPTLWFSMFPLLSITFLTAGWGTLAFLLAAFSVLVLGCAVGAFRVAFEFGARRFLRPKNIARLQAILGIAAMSGFVVFFSPRLQQRLASFAWRMPQPLFQIPLLPMSFASRDIAPATTVLVMLLWTFGAIAIAVRFAAYTTADGLSSGGGVSHGTRGRAVIALADKRRTVWKAYRLPILRAQLRMLFRDRLMWSQTLVMPVVMLGIQWLTNRDGLSLLTGTSSRALAYSFAVGSFTYSTVAVRSLAFHTRALWLLQSFPVALEHIVAQKALLWFLVGVATTTMSFVVLAPHNVQFYFDALPLVPVVLVGLALNAWIATFMGALATDPFEDQLNRRVPVSSVYLQMFVSGLYFFALYSDSAWQTTVQITLSTLLAYALWQKAQSNLPYLLDPVAAPPPQISVADGVIATMAFFVAQSIAVLTLHKLFRWSLGDALQLGFPLAGLIVAIPTLLHFWRAKLPNFAREFGLCAPRSWALSVGGGIVGGLVCAAFAALYLAGLNHFDALRALRDESEAGIANDPAMLSALAKVAIFAAPVCEEFIFRALLFAGFRRSLGPPKAALASACIFAIVHPALSVVPVGLLGYVAALLYDRSKSLLTPILVHMVYNASVFALQFANWNR